MKTEKDNKPNEDHSTNLSDIENLDKKNPFTVPENYFENLQNEIAAKIKNGPRETKVRNMSIPLIISIAAIFTVVMVSIWYVSSIQNVDNSEQMVVTYDEIIESGLATQIDDNTLINHFVSAQASNNNTSTQDKNEEEYKDYLIQNNIDITLIINEL